MAKAQRLARRSGLNRPAIGLRIRRGALRVSNQRTNFLPWWVNGLKSQSFRAAQGSYRTAEPFQAFEVPNGLLC